MAPTQDLIPEPDLDRSPADSSPEPLTFAQTEDED